MRTYEETHPWITFSINLARMDYRFWLMLGECKALSERIANVPLKPAVARKLHMTYLAKGVMATTAIEGNTLSEGEVLRRLEGKLELPASKEYLGIEVDNILEGFKDIVQRLQTEGPPTITPELIKELNRTVLRNLELDEEVIPGENRGHSVVVARYRGAPAQDLDHLLHKLTEWLTGPDFQVSDDLMKVPMAIIKAVMAHLYLACIHPFGDGNGRTARMVELAILLGAGMPTPATHLLSNHYNQTRTEYYRQLDRASRSGGDVAPFLMYAVRGLLDGLREQLKVINQQNLEVAWENFVHEQFKDMHMASDVRRRRLVLALSQHPEGVAPGRVSMLTPEIAAAYAGKTSKTVTRDINALREMGLVVGRRGLITANKDLILSLLPIKAPPNG